MKLRLAIIVFLSVASQFFMTSALNLQEKYEAAQKELEERGLVIVNRIAYDVKVTFVGEDWESTSDIIQQGQETGFLFARFPLRLIALKIVGRLMGPRGGDMLPLPTITPDVEAIYQVRDFPMLKHPGRFGIIEIGERGQLKTIELQPVRSASPPAEMYDLRGIN